jgi:CheY-like chemotaxis protein
MREKEGRMRYNINRIRPFFRLLLSHRSPVPWRWQLSKTILVVDDDSEDLSIVKEALERQGYNVVTLNDPVRAFDEIRSVKPALIILDEVMPRMMGSEIGERLLDDPRTRDIPFLFLTSLKAPDEPASGTTRNRIVAKSHDQSELIEIVSRYL